MKHAQEEQYELTAGLEVHQQLNGKKLFCSCPCIIRDDPADIMVTRTLRASAGESGKIDQAAALEQAKGKHYIYHGYSDTNCLIEFDEEPVSAMNESAINVALQVAKMLQLTVMDEVHVMRKTVVDGSNTTGFQRTALIGMNGHITVNGNRIRIEQLCLEEDSGKIIERKDNADSYNLSRLGIPLLEITTGPDLHTPTQVKEAAAYIGMLLRSTEAVKRGLGTIRQDVNVSVPNGERVEIKGVQDLDSLGTIVNNEASRQRALLNLVKIIPKQSYFYADVTAVFKNTKAGFIANAIAKGDIALAVKLTNWKENLATELMPNIRVGKELAGYAKASGFGGLIHAAEDFSKYNFQNESKQIREMLSCSLDDAWLVMIGKQDKLIAFLDNVLLPRLEYFSVGVPKEVRKAEADGTTSYLRPMPGDARMYPETDLRVFSPDLSNITIPELLIERSARLQKQYSISKDLADQLCREGVAGTFERWVARYAKVGASTIANLLVSKEKEIQTRHNISVDILEQGPIVLEALNKGNISLTSIEDIFVKLANKEPVDFSMYKPVDDNEVRRVLQTLINENPGASAGLLMGKAMRQLGNKADGKLVQRLLTELLS